MTLNDLELPNPKMEVF